MKTAQLYYVCVDHSRLNIPSTGVSVIAGSVSSAAKKAKDYYRNRRENPADLSPSELPGLHVVSVEARGTIVF